MVSKRTRHGSKFKAKVALEALKEDKTLSELSKKFEVHSSQISYWRGELARGAELVFERDGLQRRGRCEVKDNELYEEIGRLKVQLEFLKKNLVCSSSRRLEALDWGHPALSIRDQCELLGVTRSMAYYEPVGESDLNLALMNKIDELYTDKTFYGSRKMVSVLEREG